MLVLLIRARLLVGRIGFGFAHECYSERCTMDGSIHQTIFCSLSHTHSLALVRDVECPRQDGCGRPALGRTRNSTTACRACGESPCRGVLCPSNPNDRSRNQVRFLRRGGRIGSWTLVHTSIVQMVNLNVRARIVEWSVQHSDDRRAQSVRPSNHDPQTSR